MECSTIPEVCREFPRPILNGELKLVGGRVALSSRVAVRADLEVRHGRVLGITPAREPRVQSGDSPSATTIDLTGYVILPGLINAHDHLEFNLLPRLGCGPFASYQEWAASIYAPDRSPLREHWAVPSSVRLWWGGLKNLLAGVTTVCHHNPYVPEIFEACFPVSVVKRFGWAHSIAFERNITSAFLSTPRDAPFVVHLGEGTDAKSLREIFVLDRMGALDARTVVVHGVGLDAEGHALLQKRGAALVWCPTSNLFTLGRTLNSRTVESSPRLALGNDSALTAAGDLINEIRFAHRHAGIGCDRLYSLVTDSAAEVLWLRDGEGSIHPGARADLIALKDSGESPAQVLLEGPLDQIELVMVSGEPKLLSPALADRLPKELTAGFERLTVGDIRRLVHAPVAWLVSETTKHLGPRISLAGKEFVA